MRTFYVINAETYAAKEAVANAGLDGVHIEAFWDRLQPGGEGAALDSTALAELNQEITDARSLGLAVSLAHSPQYPPAWVLAADEPFKDQNDDEYLPTDPGKNVRNWIWTADGRAHVADFYTKVHAGLDPANVSAITGVKFGGGYFGELQYPPEVGSSPNWLYRGFGASMQVGTGIADGLDVCPLPDYTPFTGTDAQDVEWINWFLGGVEDFLAWQIDQLKAIGWTCRLYCMHPTYSMRNNQGRADNGWRQNFAAGVDFSRQVGVYKNDPQVWPWSTWLGGFDGWTPNTVDSDQAAWKKLYSVAAARGKHHLMGGENTGGESNAEMDDIGDEVFNDPSTGPIYASGDPVTAYIGYQHFQWLHYDNLVAGGTHATLENYGLLADAYRFPPEPSALLIESGDRLLLESGDALLLET